MHPHSPCSDPLLTCPWCRQATDSLKRFELIDVLLCLVFYFAWQTSTYMACPRCMRRLLWRNTLFNLLPGNVLWLIILVPWNLVLATIARAKGHSEEIRKMLSMQASSDHSTSDHARCCAS